MRRKTIIFLDEDILAALETSSMRKAGHVKSRAIEQYLALGLAIDFKQQLAMPVIVKCLRDDLEHLQRLASQQETARRKLSNKH